MYEIRKEGVETKPLSLYYVNMEDFPIDDQTFTLYRTLIDKVSGIHFSSGNRVVFESKLKEILRNRKMLPMEYYRCLLSDPEEVKLFLDALTTNLTSFFRNRSNWESLQHEIIPDLMKASGKAGKSVSGAPAARRGKKLTRLRWSSTGLCFPDIPIKSSPVIFP